MKGHAPAAGNPVSFVEVDGHMLAEVGFYKKVPRKGMGQVAGVGRSGPGDVPVHPDDSFGSRLRERVEDVGGLFKGFGEQVWETDQAIVSTGCAPLPGLTDLRKCWDTASGTFHRVRTDPVGFVGDAIDATTAGIREDWRSGDYTEAIGRIGAEVVASVVGGAATRGARGGAAATRGIS